MDPEIIRGITQAPADNLVKVYQGQCQPPSLISGLDEAELLVFPSMKPARRQALAQEKGGCVAIVRK